MTHKGIVSSLVISIFSIIIIFTVYWMDSSRSLWHISLITGIAILIYYVNTRFYRKANVRLNDGTVYKRVKPFKVKKRYFLWIVCIAIFIETIITFSIFKLNYNTENQERIDEALKEIPIVESVLHVGMLAPIVEEVIFRGLLYMVCSGFIILLVNRFNQNIIKKRIDRISAITFIIVSSVSFGIPHVIRAGDFENLAPYVISGFILSVLYVITKTIYVPILLHMIVNIISTFGTSYRAGIIDINISYGIAVFVFIYIILGLWIWGMLHNKGFNAIRDEIDKEYPTSGLKRRTAARKQIQALFRYVKGQMIVK